MSGGYHIGAPTLAALIGIVDALRPVAHLIDAANEGQPLAPSHAFSYPLAGGQSGGGMLAPPPGQDDEDAEPLNTSAPAVDSAGFPWDGRIHSTNKKVNGDGTWRKRRGIDEATINSVEAELKSRGAAPSQPAAPASAPFTPPASPAAPLPSMPQMPAPPAPPAMPAAPIAPPVEAPAPSMPQMPAPPAPPPAMPAAPVGNAHHDFLTKLAGAMQSVNPATGQPYLDQAYLAERQAEYKIEDFNKLAGYPEVMDHFLNRLRTDGKLLPGT